MTMDCNRIDALNTQPPCLQSKVWKCLNRDWKTMIARCLICLLLFCVPVLGQVPVRVDLREWLYQSPGNARERFQAQLSSHIISVASTGEVLVGFVTRDRTGLATRALPPLSFHILRFAKNGNLLSQGTVPTASWYENAVFYGSKDTLLIRAGTKLYLFSLKMEQLAVKDLPLTPNSGMVDWKVEPLPARDAFVLYNYRRADTSIALVSWTDLKPIRQCDYDPDGQLLSVSKRNLLSFRPGGAKEPLKRRLK